MRLTRFALLALLLAILTLPAAQAAPNPPVLELGQYPHTADGAAAPIRWLVLADDAQGVTLLCEQVLDVLPVQAEGRYDGFEGSGLQAWLQGAFTQAAFNQDEQAWLVEVTLPGLEQLRKKDGGFFEPAQMGAKPTAYARSKGVQLYKGGDASYWLSDRATSVSNGQRRVMEAGSVGYAIVTYKDIGVRPLVRLSPGALAGALGSGSQEAPYTLRLAGTAAPEAASAPEATAVPETAAEAPEKPAAPGRAATQGIDTTRTATLHTEGFPPLTDQGFLPAGEKEFVMIDEAGGRWLYANQDLRLVITRHENKTDRLRWLTAEIFVRPGAETLKMYSYDKDNMLRDLDRYLEKPYKIAMQHNLVFAMDGDYFIYRIGRLRSLKVKDSIGIVIRDHELLMDAPATEKRNIYPPLDHVALFADGDMQVFKNTGVTAQELLDMGARDVLSFGPYLIKDGVINTSYTNYGTTLQPRAALGMVEKGHYFGVIVEGRIGVSRGMTCLQVADLMQELGCVTAFNLDGGWTSAMIFMGKQLNQLDNQGVRNNARTQNEVMGIGFTDAYTLGTAP